MRARLLPLAAALVAFGASLGSGFHFDDYAIFSDPVFRSKLGLLELWRLPQPLTRLTYWLNYEVGGADPLGYHLLNLALHIGAVLLVYECLRRLLPARAAVIAAALFAVHPIQAEAVNYVWARGIVLAALLCFASLIAWTGGRRGIALGWFAAALLADPGCAAFPLVPLLIEARKANLRQVWRYGIGMLALAAAGLAHASLLPLGGGGSWWRYFLAQGTAIPRYLRLLAVPWGFTVDPDIATPAAWLGLLAWAGIAAAAVRLWRMRKEWALWLFMGVILLLPASLLLPSADLAADRRMYLAMFAFAAAAGLLLERVKQPAVAAVLVVVLAGLGAARTWVWMSDARLWREAVRRAPGKVRPKIQLARAVPAAGALELLGDAARLAPNDPDVAAETGRVFLKEQQFEAAVEEFGRALALDPYSAVNYNDRGVALEQMGQTAAARMDFQRALDLDPGLREARENLARTTGAR